VLATLHIIVVARPKAQAKKNSANRIAKKLKISHEPYNQKKKNRIYRKTNSMMILCSNH